MNCGKKQKSLKISHKVCLQEDLGYYILINTGRNREGAGLGYSLRRDKEDLIIRVARYVPSEGKRSVSGQKLLFCNTSQGSLREAPQHRWSEKYDTLPKTATTGVIWLPPAETMRIDPQMSLHMRSNGVTPLPPPPPRLGQDLSIFVSDKNKT